MKADRLHALAQAYGADRRRWPADERALADSLIAADPSMQAALEDAAALDALLAASAAVRPSPALASRVLAQAPRPRRAWRRGPTWFLGAGWAAAACAGVVAGVGLSGRLTADARADAVLYQATFDVVDDAEVWG